MTEQQTKATEQESKRYAAYDTTLLRFVTKPCDSKAAAAKEARDRKVKDFEIREV